MKLLNTIFEDIKKGENIDLYITIVSAIVLSILNLFSIIPQEKIIAVNMAIMALITVTILGNRHRIELINSNFLKSNYKTDYLTEFPATFAKKMLNSKEIILVGTHLSSMITSNYKIFEDKLSKGHKIKFLLMEPNGNAAEMATMRFPGKTSIDREKSTILGSLETLMELQKSSPENLEIRTIDFLIDYSAYFFDPKTSSSSIFVERHTFKTSGGTKKPKAVYDYGEDIWFLHLKSEIEILWKTANEVKATANNV